MALNRRRFALAVRALYPLHRLPKTALVACSGGVDSMVLTDLLRELYREKGRGTLVVAHFDHGQRSRKEHDADHALVEEYCKRHALTFHFEKLTELPTAASEAAMRAARYRALARLAQAHDDAVVFTAHHAGDQLETFLLRLLRGAHPETLAGIAPRSKRKISAHELRLARPLLAFSKAELVATARARGLVWNDDATNTRLATSRNRVRNELIPTFERLNAKASTHILNFFSSLARENQARAPKTSEIKKIAQCLLSQEGYSVAESKTGFAHLKAAIDRLMDEHSQRTTRAHWVSLKRQLALRAKTKRGGGPEKSVQFPGGYCLRLRGDRLFWIRNSPR